MKASEARSKTYDVIRTKVLLDTAEVNNKIDKAIMKGEFIVHIYADLNEAAINHLKSDGYKVERVDDRNETYLTISW